MDALDADLEDPDLLAEVELTAALMVIANQHDGRVAQDTIDRALGVVARSA